MGEGYKNYAFCDKLFIKNSSFLGEKYVAFAFLKRASTE
jgi:hypothetical protein